MATGGGRSGTRGGPAGRCGLVLLLLLGAAPSVGAAGLDAGDEHFDGAVHERRLAVGGSEVALRVRTARPAPGTGAVHGDGLVLAPLPLDGALSLRVPYTLAGERSELGTSELAARYDLADETRLRPGLSVAALVGLPGLTLESSRGGAEPGVRATVRKRLGPGSALEGVHVEGELRAPVVRGDAPSRVRTAVGASLRLGARTRGAVDCIHERPLRDGRSAATGAVASTHAQLGLEHSFTPGTALTVAAAAGRADDARSLRGTIGLVREF